MVGVSIDVVEDTSEYVLHKGTAQLDSQTTISKLQDGEVSSGTVTIPLTLNEGTGVSTEEVSFDVGTDLSAEGGYAAKESEEEFLVLLWRQTNGGNGETLYVIENEYAYNPNSIPNAQREYAAYSEPASPLGVLRSRIGRRVAPIVDNIKQNMLSNEWVTVLRDEDAVEVAVNMDSPIKMAAVSVAVNIRIFIITEEEVEGEQREVVKHFSYPPPFPVTAEGAQIKHEDGFSVVAPRCDLDEMMIQPLRVTNFS